MSEKCHKILVKTSDIYVRYESFYFLNRGEEMNEIAGFDRSRRPGNADLCCAMRRGYLKLHNAGREVEALRTGDSVTITMVSWPFYVWIEARKDDVLVDEEAHLIRQNFTLIIKTVNEMGRWPSRTYLLQIAPDAISDILGNCVSFTPSRLGNSSGASVWLTRI